MKRIEKLQRVLLEKKLFGLIIDNPVDLFYLTGLDLSLGRLFIERKRATLFVDGRYFEACKKEGKIPVEKLEGNGFYTFLNKVKGREKKIGFDATYTSYESFVDLSSFSSKDFSFIPWQTPCAPIRAIKEKEEIEKIKKAATLNAKGFHYASSLLKPGITEEEVAQKLTIFFLENGGDKIGFSPIIAFGENAALPHYRPKYKRALKKGEIVLIDIGVVVDRYNSDLTRVVFFGACPPVLKKIYQIVKASVKAALEKCEPGVKVKELDKAARDVIEKAGYGEYFTHSLGHGVGLEVHEFPRLRQGKPQGEVALQPGMVVTIEPGIYLPSLGGVRLEELITITKTGYENLTQLEL